MRIATLRPFQREIAAAGQSKPALVPVNAAAFLCMNKARFDSTFSGLGAPSSYALSSPALTGAAGTRGSCLAAPFLRSAQPVQSCSPPRSARVVFNGLTS